MGTERTYTDADREHPQCHLDRGFPEGRREEGAKGRELSCRRQKRGELKRREMYAWLTRAKFTGFWVCPRGESAEECLRVKKDRFTAEGCVNNAV